MKGAGSEWDKAIDLAVEALEKTNNSNERSTMCQLNADDIETIRIHLSAIKEQLANQHRWKEAEEYQGLIDRFLSFASVQPEERTEEHTETHACDCISRQGAIDEIDEWIKAFRENGHKESAADACLIQDGIIQLPSVQPDIIRCKDCKHKGTKNCVANAWTTILGVTVKDDFYCGLAEKENR